MNFLRFKRTKQLTRFIKALQAKKLTGTKKSRKQVEKIYKNGLTLWKNKQFKDAGVYFKQYKQEPNANAQILTEIGHLYYQKEKFNCRQLPFYERAIGSGFRQSKLLYQLGKTYHYLYENQTEQDLSYLIKARDAFIKIRYTDEHFRRAQKQLITIYVSNDYPHQLEAIHYAFTLYRQQPDSEDAFKIIISKTLEKSEPLINAPSPIVFSKTISGLSLNPGFKKIASPLKQEITNYLHQRALSQGCYLSIQTLHRLNQDPEIASRSEQFLKDLTDAGILKKQK